MAFPRCVTAEMAETVVLAAGEFPRRDGTAWRLLARATRVIACDGAARAYRRHFRKWPTVIVGDLDSLPPSAHRSPAADRPEIVHIAEQETNDLEKALNLCRARGWNHPVVVGAMGLREDHAIGNVFRALACGVEIVTDDGRFVPVVDHVTLKVAKGTPVSVFAPDPRTRMTSLGLQWPLDGVRFRNLYCATLNRASDARIRLTATHPVSVFVCERLPRTRGRITSPRGASVPSSD